MLINPPISLEERYGVMKDVGTLYLPLGLAYIAAAAKEEKCEVKVLDCEALNCGLDHVKEQIRDFQPSIIGMQVFFTNLDRSYQVAEAARSINPDIKICLGGPEATISWKQIINNINVDFIVKGEGDITFRELIRALKGDMHFDNINGLVYKNDRQAVENPERLIIEDLDTLPMPSRELFPMHLYHSSANLRGRRTFNLMTSRGCPFRCAYCAGHRIFGKTYRYHSTARVISEIKELVGKYGADSLQFYDETFTLHKDRIYELCEAMRKENLHKLPWACFTRVNLVDEDLLKAMKQAGCYQIFYGIESGVQRLLDLIQKDITLEKARKAVRDTKKAGIEAFCSFMLALPSETVAESLQTIDFALELDPDYAQFPITTPYPNTLLFELAQQNGTIVSDVGTQFTSWDKVAYLPSGRDAQEIISTVSLAYRRFYLRPSYVIKRALKLRHLPPKKIMGLIKSGLKTFSLPKNSKLFIPAQD